MSGANLSRIGENEKAIERLEKAFEERNGEMVFLKGEIDGAAEGDSLNSLANDPRLINLLQNPIYEWKPTRQIINRRSLAELRRRLMDVFSLCFYIL